MAHEGDYKPSSFKASANYNHILYHETVWGEMGKYDPALAEKAESSPPLNMTAAVGSIVDDISKGITNGSSRNGSPKTHANSPVVGNKSSQFQYKERLPEPQHEEAREETPRVSGSRGDMDKVMEMQGRTGNDIQPAHERETQEHARTDQAMEHAER